MMTRFTDQNMARTAKAGLLLSGIGLLLVSPAFGQNYINDEATPVSHSAATKVYEQAERNLDTEYTRLINESLAISNAAESLLGDGCGDSGCGDSGCGDGGCGDGGCSSCSLGEPFRLQDHLFDDSNDSGINIGGWMQWGYTSENNGLFNNHSDNVNLNQLWLFAEKEADGSCGWDLGYRADFVYGVDAQDTQAFGNPSGSWDFENGWDNGIYGWAMPQLYVELANGPLSIKAGRFFTLAGYEVVTAPGNFFYSHAFTMYNSEPFTHTGAIATYQVGDGVEVYGGWTAGWDSGFDSIDNGSNFLGGASVEVNDSTTLTYITTIGDFGARGEGYSHSIVVDHNINDCWNYVFQSDLVETNNGGDHQVGINQYLFRTISDCVKAGARLEWWKAGQSSITAITAGVNYKANANLVVRPEIRHQWAGNEAFFAGGPLGIPVDETIFGVDAILTF